MNIPDNTDRLFAPIWLTLLRGLMGVAAAIRAWSLPAVEYEITS